MDVVRAYNPFAKRERVDPRALATYKILTVLSWFVLVIASIYYSVTAPTEHGHKNRTIWGQNSAYKTPFAMNSVVVGLYWIILFNLQLGYVWHLYSANEEWVVSAANVGSHFICSNLLLFGFIMLWVRSYFWLGEFLILVNFFNLLALYMRHPTTPRPIHIPVVSGPLAWNFVAIFWVGAAAVNAHNLAARIVANIFIWSFLIFGASFLLIFQDYTVGFEMSFLTLALALTQFFTKVVALQWIFAFVIFGLLFVLSLAVAVPGLLGKDFKFGGARDENGQHVVDGEDRERQPLLQGE